MMLTEFNAMIFTPRYFSFLRELDAETLLRARRSSPFKEQWDREWEAIQPADPLICRFPLDELSMIYRTVEKAFMASFSHLRAGEISKPHSEEIAELIESDMELIGKSIALGREGSWTLTVLLEAYKNNSLPH